MRADPEFKLPLERLWAERDLCSQLTISRLENLPDRRMLLQMARSLAMSTAGEDGVAVVDREIRMDRLDRALPVIASIADSADQDILVTAADR